MHRGYHTGGAQKGTHRRAQHRGVHKVFVYLRPFYTTSPVPPIAVAEDEAQEALRVEEEKNAQVSLGP